MNKMVINHLEKLFVTNDAATILRELEVRKHFVSNVLRAGVIAKRRTITVYINVILLYRYSTQQPK